MTTLRTAAQQALEMSSNHGIRREAAAELRRLHAENETMLKALKTVVKEFRRYGRQHWPEAVKAQAAIAKCEEKE